MLSRRAQEDGAPAVPDVAPECGGPAETVGQCGGGVLRQRHHLLQRHRRLHGAVCEEHAGADHRPAQRPLQVTAGSTASSLEWGGGGVGFVSLPSSS